MFLILLLFFNFCHKNLHIFALPSSAVLKPAQAGLVFLWNLIFLSFRDCVTSFCLQEWLSKIYARDKKTSALEKYFLLLRIAFIFLFDIWIRNYSSAILSYIHRSAEIDKLDQLKNIDGKQSTLLKASVDTVQRANAVAS